MTRQSQPSHQPQNRGVDVDVSVVIPVYNEEENVGDLNASIHDALEGQIDSFEVVFIDDGSSDNTLDVLRSVVESNDRVRLVKLRGNFGQTTALRAGIEAARGEIIVTMDGDRQNDPRDIPAIVDRIHQGADVVSGWRRDRQDKLIVRKVPSKIANWIIRKVTGVPIHDTGCALKAYRAELIQQLPLYSDMHRFLPAVSAMGTSRFDEMVVRHHPRTRGESKYGLSRVGKVVVDILTVKMLVSFSRRPLLYFGFWSLAAFATATFAGCYCLFLFAYRDDPSLVVSAAATLLFVFLGLHLLFAGIFAELVVHSDPSHGVAPLRQSIRIAPQPKI